MAVYFAFRSPYEAPGGKYLKRFDDDSVLDWFRNRWERLASTDWDDANDRVTEEMGCYVYSFADVFRINEEGPVPPPRNGRKLADHVEGRVYNNGVAGGSPHVLQVDTDDDEYGFSYYFFDDHYLKKHGKHAAFLLCDWKLPGGHGTGGFRAAEPTVLSGPKGAWPGTTYLIDLDSVGCMDELVPGYRIEGVRLPELARYVLRTPPSEEEDTPSLLHQMPLLMIQEGPDSVGVEKAFLKDIREHPNDEVVWNAYSDWLQERGDKPVGLHLLHRALTRLGVWADNGVWDEVPAGERKVIESGEQNSRALVELLDRRQKEAEIRVHVDEHLAQLCFREHRCKYPKRTLNIYEQWIVFDDLWASAHPDLANSILRYVQRWDLLSTSRTRSRE